MEVIGVMKGAVDLDVRLVYHPTVHTPMRNLNAVSYDVC